MQNFNVTERVTEIVLHVGAVSTATDNKQFLEVIEAVKAIPEFVSIDGREFRYNEFEIWIGQLAHSKEKIDALDALASFDLSAAPSFVSSIPIGSSHCAIVSRYAACPGERLARVETTTGPFREAASRRFRAEMQTLIDHGLVHPFVRGPYHWLVSSETGTLVLDSWYALRECDREEGVQMMEKVDRQLASRSEAAPTPRLRATENTTAPTRKSRVQEVFGCPRVLLPVIHPIDQPTAMESVRVAHAAGVKGIFLINQGMTTEQVLELVMGVRARFPTLWIGLNLLGCARRMCSRSALLPAPAVSTASGSTTPISRRIPRCNRSRKSWSRRAVRTAGTACISAASRSSINGTSRPPIWAAPLPLRCPTWMSSAPAAPAPARRPPSTR
jgi:hypothetical protein